MYFRGVHAEDLSHWQGDRKDSSFGRLAEAIKPFVPPSGNTESASTVAVQVEEPRDQDETTAGFSAEIRQLITGPLATEYRPAAHCTPPREGRRRAGSTGLRDDSVSIRLVGKTAGTGYRSSVAESDTISKSTVNRRVPSQMSHTKEQALWLSTSTRSPRISAAR